MKKITSRAVICLLLSLALIAGTCIFIYRFVNNADSWVAYPSNRHLYTNGQLSSGRVLDDNDSVLAAYNGGWQYSDDRDTRLGTIQVVGDPGGHIGTGALTAFAGDLSGYNLFTGTGSGFTRGRDLHLTINADLSAAAYDALDGRNGFVSVYNYKTGRILCMVSTPAYDPDNPKDSSKKSGAYINKVISSKFAPGSTFKLITATAAMSKIDGIEDEKFTCRGTEKIGGYKVTCPRPHGTVNMEKALNESCNCYFGKLAARMGAGTMKGYADQTGLTSSYSINGIETKKSSFDFSSGGSEALAWGGIGQSRDLVNPLSMMVFCGAVANGGKSAYPQIIDHTSFIDGMQTSKYETEYTDELIDPSVSETLTEYMRSDVTNHYRSTDWVDDLCAKTGTAQVDKTKASNGWFVGFLNNTDHPLAFVCMVEEGGAGERSAGPVVNKTLRKAIELGF